MERRAAADIVGGPDFPSVRVNDGAADGKAQSHSLLFRSEERLEDALHLFFRNAAAVVNDRYVHSAAVLQFGNDKQPALRRVEISHRFARIQHQVKQDLLKLDPVAGDRGQIPREFNFHGHVSVHEIVAH